MADLIDELLQSGSVDQSALASQLRREQQYGRVGALSGSSRLAPFAAATQQNAEAQAADIGGMRNEQANKQMQRSLEQWKAEMAAAARRADIQARASEGRLERSSREGIAGAQIGSRERLAKTIGKTNENDAKAREIGRQMAAAINIAEDSIKKHGSGGGPIVGRSGLGLATGEQDAFEGDMAPLSNAVRAQIRLYFKDAAQSNIELAAFEANIPKWQDLPATRMKKLENIREVYSPEAMQTRAVDSGPSTQEQFLNIEDEFDAGTD